MNRFWKLLLLIVFIILSDQLIKGAVQTHLTVGETQPFFGENISISYLCNYGALMGFLSDAPSFFRHFSFIYLPIIAAFFLMYLLVTSLRQPFYLSLIYSLVLAGTVSNTLDRVSLGYVVDWLSLRAGSFWLPTFNLADAAIFFGISIILIDILIDLFKIPKDI